MTHSPYSQFTMSPLGLSEKFKCITDERGTLCVAQKNQLSKPFDVKRVFWICKVPTGATRGEHANRNCTELLVAVNGSVTVTLTNGHTECEFLLDSPSKGLYIPPMVWCRLKDFTPDCVCVCMANQDYDEKYYINNYEEFINEAKQCQ